MQNNERDALQAAVDRTTEAVVSGFRRIHRERMHGLPILHPGLEVAVVGARAWQGDWIGILVTPWCMNLLMVPGPETDHPPGALGTKQVLAFPAGCFELIASEEARIGRFCACSLFSPMNDFADQEAALATAAAVAMELFDPTPDPTPSVPGDRAGISRRDLLRGAFSRRP